MGVHAYMHIQVTGNDRVGLATSPRMHSLHKHVVYSAQISVTGPNNWKDWKKKQNKKTKQTPACKKERWRRVRKTSNLFSFTDHKILIYGNFVSFVILISNGQHAGNKAKNRNSMKIFYKVWPCRSILD